MDVGDIPSDGYRCCRFASLERFVDCVRAHQLPLTRSAHREFWFDLACRIGLLPKVGDAIELSERGSFAAIRMCEASLTAGRAKWAGGRRMENNLDVQVDSGRLMRHTLRYGGCSPLSCCSMAQVGGAFDDNRGFFMGLALLIDTTSIYAFHQYFKSHGYPLLGTSVTVPCSHRCAANSPTAVLIRCSRSWP